MLKRVLLVIVGLLFTALAAVGAFLPGLPTTPFLIVAIVCFANSSKRLHRWLERIPLFRVGLKHAHLFLKHKAVTRRVKIISTSFAWVAFAITFAANAAAWNSVTIGVLIAALTCTIAMLSIKTWAGEIE